MSLGGRLRTPTGLRIGLRDRLLGAEKAISLLPELVHAVDRLNQELLACAF
jgi:hypothetical protein